MEMNNTYPSPDAKSKDHLFSFLTKSDDVENSLGFPLIVGIDMQKVFPEIKSMTRFQAHEPQLVKANNAIYNKTRVLYADDNFFNNFSFHIKKGNAKTALQSINNVIISESAAKKYFGKAEAIGKTIQLVSDTTRLFMVAAIAEDAPANSSIQYDVVIPLMADPGYAENIEQKFNQNSHLLVVELNENISAAQFENKLNEWARKYFAQPFVVYGQSYTNKIDANFHWHLRPLADCHYNASGGWGHYTNAKNIYQLACLVIIILLIASLNYVLLVISNAASRSQEVGVRKVMGANRRAIILQFWVETQIVVVISVIIGLALTSLMLPLFNSVIGSDLNFADFSWKEIIPALLILCVVLGIIAGYYPALIISKMKIVSIIKSFQTFKINPRFSKVMVVLQYTACVVLMISAFIISRQMNYINNKDLGFDKEQVLMVTNPTFDSDFTKRTRNLLMNFSKTQPCITQFSGMNGGLDGGYDLNGFKLNGEQKWRKEISVDYNYFDMLGIKFLQGRPFSSAIASDTSIKMRPVIVNETLFNMLGKTAKLGQYCEPIYSTIIGVVKDYNFETLSKKIEPQEHRLTSGYEMYFMFKIKAGQTQQAISKIEKEWKSITDYPFEYTFLDQTIKKMYDADLRWQKTIQASSFFAIFIACMGLFGLSAINAINRTKEVGIRKVLGASVKEIVVTLSSNFLIMVAIAIFIATPLAWWIMNKWLEDFAYRIHISWWMFVLVGASAILIAFATVSFQAIKAALMNPVKSLRSE